jgi:hypothetical protein
MRRRPEPTATKKASTKRARSKAAATSGSRAGPQFTRGITVRLDEATLADIGREAAKMGIGPTTLIRMWVLERLRDRPIRRSARR